MKKSIANIFLTAAIMVVTVVCFMFSVSAAYENNYENIGDHRKDIIGVAKTQLGYTEGTNNDNKYGASFNHNNVAWCAYFVSWCARQAGIPESVLQTSSRAGHASGCFNIPVVNHTGTCYEQSGCDTNSNYVPKPGDLFFTKSWGHVGLVYYVDGDYFYTIEGNSNSEGSNEGWEVCSNRRYIKDYYFGVPKYTTIAVSHTTNTNYGKNYTAYLKSPSTNHYVFDSNHSSTGGYVNGNDPCTIHEVYTDGCCKFTYILDSGNTRTAYGKIEWFNSHTHSYSSKVTKAATCTNTGTRTYTCSCGNSYTETISALGHDYSGQRVHQGEHPHEISQRCIRYDSCGGYKWTGENYKDSSCRQCWDAKFTLSVSSVTLNLATSPTKTTTFSFGGTYPSGAKYQIASTDISVVECTSDFSAGKLNLTAKKAGTAKIKFVVYESDGQSIISQVNLSVTVESGTYSVKYNSNGGTGAPSSQTKTHGTALKLSTTVPDRLGYSFLGWSTSSGATSYTYRPGDNYTKDSDIQLYAFWQAPSTISSSVTNSSYSASVPFAHGYKYYVFTPSESGKYRFESSGDPDSQIYIYSSSGSLLTSDDDDGEGRNFLETYAFTAGTKYFIKIKLYNSATGTVNFTVKRVYNIKYNANGGSGTPSTQEKIHGTNITLSSSKPTRSGYTFLGWSTSAISTTVSYQPGNTFATNSDTTLYAVWSHNCSYTKTIENVPATCTSRGKQVIACSCGKTTTLTSAATGHSYNSYYTTDKAATCTTNGSKSKHCANCDAKTSVTTIYASDHSYDNGRVTKNATCTANGSKTYTCKNCGDTKTETLSKLNHSYNSKITKSATCTTAGTRTYTCSCGDSYTETIAKTGHSYNSYYTTDKAATCTTNGSKSKHCANCDAKTSVTTIAKLAHANKITTTKATLTKNGKVESKCSVCGYVSKTTTIYYPKTIKLSATSYTYNGKTKTPTVTVKDSKGNTLKKDTDYTITYASGRKNTGKYSVTVTFKGKYSGTKTLYFNILPSKTSKITPTCATTSIKASWKKVTGASGYKVELLNSKGKVVKTVTTTKTAYTFEKLSKVTTYKIRVTAYKTIDSKKVYSTSYTTITTSTAPAKVTLSKVSAGSKSATPTWKKVSGASGYEVMYSTSSKFSSSKTATVNKGSSTKTTIKSLTKGKTYYFKVRAYKTVDGNKVYGAWSATKSVKVK